jgi:SAM-dependent methyltransferase
MVEMRQTPRQQSDVKEKYKDYLNTREGADTYNGFKQILYGTPDSLVLRLGDGIAERLERKNINVLDVGGGDGKRLRLLRSLLGERGVESIVRLIEPSGIFTDDLKQSLAASKPPEPIEVIRSTFEAYEANRRYDLMLLVHSIFTFKDRAYIDQIGRSLKPDGLLVVASNDTDSFLTQLKAVTDATFGTKRREIASVWQDLEQAGYSLEFVRSTTTSAAVCMENGQLNENGKLLLRWIALRDWEDIPPEIVAAATEVFARNSVDGRIQEKEVFTFARWRG